MKRIFIIIISMVSAITYGQEQVFFTEGTDNTFYDQGIVDVANLGDVVFDHVAPPCCPEYDDKLPCSTIANNGATSLRFHYIPSATANGRWKATVFRNDWADIDVTANNYLSFYLYSTTALSKDLLPKIGLRVRRTDNDAEEDTEFFNIAAYNVDVPANTWVRVGLPLSVITEGVPAATYNFTKVKAVVFSQNDNDAVERTLYIDDIQTTTEVANGILDAYGSGVLVMPNPVQSVAEIVIPSELLDTDILITVSSATGSEVYRNQISGQQRLPIDMSSFADGLYFIRLSNGTESIVKKVIKR
ncbi:T9SS type A sorting domain-containing protein [Carboxylicivirga mesophila]|uniref:T9SS type A sorting domain-containing protein n=1 Tax=Carboxylicivirga mesophila TaxID=1166478 RepID=A0ABS5K7Y2_9BACT|nr:T9SS type A sorting domain-containing protein [Carboxylicivirga mesophila]MBS2210992.1 T9SS type A sorting domain-containing protein [Carboxylicivirga mesophila]